MSQKVRPERPSQTIAIIALPESLSSRWVTRLLWFTGETYAVGSL